MGVYINLVVSKSVPDDEWARVYEESLALVKAFPFAERREIEINGFLVTCLARTEEREFFCGWSNEKREIGWCAEADYSTMEMAEAFFLPRDLSNGDGRYSDIVDAMLYDACFSGVGNEAEREKWASSIRCLWDSKTQGSSYHLLLLAVGCLIEARLGAKASVSGDITVGQCRKAVAMANEVLAVPIDVPDQCDAARLIARLSDIRLVERDRLKLFFLKYLGVYDLTLGDFIRDSFSPGAIEGYWSEVFSSCDIGSYRFRERLRDYLLLGFSLADLGVFVSGDCCVLSGDGGEKREDEVSWVERIVNAVLDTKIYIEEKDSTDVLAIDQDAAAPYNTAMQFARIVFGSLRNWTVDRYIPIEEVRRDLGIAFGDKADVDAIIDRCLSGMDEAGKNETLGSGKASEEFASIVKKIADDIASSRETYDVSDYGGLLRYKQGDSISPEILESVEAITASYTALLEEPEYATLMEAGARKRCEWLVSHNHQLLIRDIDWERILTDVEGCGKSFARYYSIVRVSGSHGRNQQCMDVAFALNDDLFSYFML